MTGIDWAVMDKHSRVAKCKRHCFPLKIGSELAAVCMKFKISHEEVEGRGVRGILKVMTHGENLC